MGRQKTDGETDRLRFHALGPFEVHANDRVLDLGGLRIRTLLALLTANTGRVTSVSAIAEALWGMDAPPDAHRTVRTYVSRLRRSLAPAAVGDLIATHPAGYVLRLTPERLDAFSFERLVAEGRDALATSRPDVATETLSRALALWRGDAYGEFAGTPPLRAEAARLHELRLSATEDRIAADLAIGAGVSLIDELTRLTEQHPGHDRLWELLMTALYRAGRQADALDAFARARSVLVERFGLDPSPRLVEIHRQVLDNDERLFGTPAQIRTEKDTTETARNDLPGDIADFAGRRTELAGLLGTQAGVPPTAVVIEAIDGMAGVGKTTLAVHAAHRLTDRYPDAQLFIDLHGHASQQRAVTPMAALDTLLRALGVAPEDIPKDADARAALWRAQLAARSVLVVLDNAADSAQVRPLLPGTARSLALVTSRRRLADLDAAHILSLNVLPEDDAIALFTSIAGDRHGPVSSVVTLCGHLPLAIRLAAGRLRARPVWTVQYLADRLRQASRPLTELAAGDRSVAAAFALSYDHLDAAQQRMFRLLGVHPGRDIDTGAAAALAGVPVTEAEQLLESLVDDHLLEQPTTGRYRFHDLVRLHAKTVALTEEPKPSRVEAVRRVADFYLHTAYRGSRLLDQQHPPIDLDPPVPGCVPDTLTNATAAMAWFDANHECVLAARAAAEDSGWDVTAWRLAWTLDNFHYRRGHIHDNITSWVAGLAAAERLGDLAVQARAHRRLGLVYTHLGKPEKAEHHLALSLAISGRIGDTLGEAGAHYVLSMAWTHRGDDDRALHHAIRARDVYRELGDSTWEVRSLGLIGVCHTRLGEFDEARDHCTSALTLSRQQGDAYGEADSLHSLGAIAAATDDHLEALNQYHQALTRWHALDNTYRQAGTLNEIGDIHARLDNHAQAHAAWQDASATYRALNLHAAADRITKRAKPLGQLTGYEPATR